MDNSSDNPRSHLVKVRNHVPFELSNNGVGNNTTYEPHNHNPNEHVDITRNHVQSVHPLLRVHLDNQLLIPMFTPIRNSVAEVNNELSISIHNENSDVELEVAVSNTSNNVNNVHSY